MKYLFLIMMLLINANVYCMEESESFESMSDAEAARRKKVFINLQNDYISKAEQLRKDWDNLDDQERRERLGAIVALRTKVDDMRRELKYLASVPASKPKVKDYQEPEPS